MIDTTPKLLLSAREAAAAMSVSEKHLWTLTAPRGPIPCVRLGHRVLYSLSDLEQWIEGQRQGGLSNG